MFLLPVGGSSILGNMLLGTTVKIARKLSVVSNCHYSLSSIIGLVVNSPKEKTFQQWQQAVNESWFSSQSAFLANVAYAPIKFSKPFEDTPMTRAMGIFAHFGLVRRYTTCIHPGCNSPAKIHVHKRSDNGQLSYTWTCGTSGHNHMHEGPVGEGLLSTVRTGSWMPLLNFIVLLKINSPLIKIYSEVKDAWGSNIDPKTFRVWRRLYQEGLQNAMLHWVFW